MYSLVELKFSLCYKEYVVFSCLFLNLLLTETLFLLSKYISTVLWSGGMFYNALNVKIWPITKDSIVNHWWIDGQRFERFIATFQQHNKNPNANISLRLAFHARKLWERIGVDEREREKYSRNLMEPGAALVKDASALVSIKLEEWS